MKYLKSWLQDYIVETLPHDSVIEDTLNKKAFEVEEVEATTEDSIFDIKVLPNRAHDALGHRGMARELCADFAFTFKEDKRVLKDESLLDKNISAPLLEIDDAKACMRFMSIQIDGVTVGESPEWLKTRLESIGQRSINNIVDITNYVQFALNKPMHAYDSRSIKGTLRARFAKTGETLTTLDDKELKLNGKTLVIADDEKVLGLAGIKGGKFSGIQNDTTSIILESANFEPTLIRKTSQKYGIKTDASKRFENGIANSLVEEGLYMTANIIKELCSEAKASEATDVYLKKDTPYNVGISLKELNNILGANYSGDEIKSTLSALAFPFEIITPEGYIKETYPKLIGATYKNPSSMREDAPEAFSCSSLVSYLYKGVWMPSLSIDKYVFSNKVSKEELSFGDLIFANTGEGKIRFESVEFLRGTKVEDGVDHVGVYLGDDKVIHATKVHGKVVVESIDEFVVGRKIIGYGRVVENLKEEIYVINVPSERLDVRIKEDLAEEVGRIIGYEKLIPTLPQLNRTGLQNKRMYYENKIREILFEKGFSEVITYTFGNVGEVKILKGIADDKEKLRTNLGGGILQSLSLNLYNAPLLGQNTIKIFEIGNVFETNKETRNITIAIDDGMKKSNFTESVELVLLEIKHALSVSEIEYETVSNKPYVIEFNFDKLIEQLPEPTKYEAPTFASLPMVGYKSVSSYPFVTRDIAVWVPAGTTWKNIIDLCGEVRNYIVVRIDLFDTFSKEIEGIKKTSFAFRLVFQSYEKTLTDEEVNKMMEPYYELFKSKGYEIR
ncbi:MAG: phenylalanine--tRNA ligase beta subunit-related protein [Candidatus Paceibacterota bacterium]|jgi:phenylalanyl-tRNA synthetase beta subunit